MIQCALGAVNELCDVDVRTREIRYRRESGTQSDLAPDCFVLGRPIELALKPRDQQPCSGGISIRRQNRKPGVTDVPNDIGLTALLAEDVCNICESGGTFLPQHARSHFAVVHLRGDRDASERLVPSEGARAELPSELPQTE
jgi:hypothetical protein